MKILKDKKTIADILEASPFLNAYALGDLDDFYYDQTVWFGDVGKGKIALLYIAENPPVLHILCDRDEILEYLEFIDRLKPYLPYKFYTHLTPGLDSAFSNDYAVESHGRHFKMKLEKAERLSDIDTSIAKGINASNLTELEELYENSYPGNWFDPRMLETGMYFGVFDDGGNISSVAGIHVYSEKYRVAALGNITTLPSQRGKSLAKIVTARLCKELFEKNIRITLNVKSDNVAAIKAYSKLGFVKFAEYDEAIFRRK